MVLVLGIVKASLEILGIGIGVKKVVLLMSATVPCQEKKYIFSIVSTPQESNQGEKALIAVQFWKVENGLRVAWQCRSEKQFLFWKEYFLYWTKN